MAEKKKTAKRDIRKTINVIAIIDALEKHIFGDREMTATQVNAALALLKKTLPDLSGPVRKDLPETETTGAHEDALQELE